MNLRLFAVALATSISLAACGGASSTTLPATSTRAVSHKPSTIHVTKLKTARIHSLTTQAPIADGGFESGNFGAWQSCGDVSAQIVAGHAHSGTYSALSGSTSSPEVNGYSGVCQTVTVPTNGTLSFYVDEATNDSINYADQEADLLDANGYVIDTLFSEATTTHGWQLRSYDLSAYAGQSVTLFFGVYGNGWNSGYIDQYVDDVSFGGVVPTPGPTSTPSPTPRPTATPNPTPGPTATPNPTPGPTATPNPTPSPTATPNPTPQPTNTPGAYPCDDSKFLSDQQLLKSGAQSGYIEEDVCGTVTQVLPEKTTASGPHGYFYVQVDAAGDTIEIVSNLNEMNAPAWPWVSVGDYAYVQGRQYYDSNGTAGIDWTHHGTSSSWPTAGYVVINGVQYQ